MGLVEIATLINRISPPLDTTLASTLVNEFVSMERRFIQRDWEPTELDGGHFCEALARLLYHQDSGNLDLSRQFNDCLVYIESSSSAHNIVPQSDARHIAKVLRSIYNLRNQRGVAHISPTYTPNHMDSKLMIECVRWCFNETLRIYWQGSREELAKAIRELLQFDVPCIGNFEGVLVVQRTDLTAEEEILLLLHYAGEQGFSRKSLGIHSTASPSTVTTVIQKLRSPQLRQIVQISDANYRLTDLGSKRLREQLASKLLMQ